MPLVLSKLIAIPLTVREPALVESTIAVPDIKLYVNGEYVNHNFFDKLLPIQEQDFLYLGVGNPERDAKQNWFNGVINSFAIYNEVLDDNLCKQISANINSSLYKFSDREFLKL